MGDIPTIPGGAAGVPVVDPYEDTRRVMKLTPDELPRRGGTTGIEVRPFAYALPPAAHEDVSWLEQQIALVHQLLATGNLAEAHSQLTALGIVPGNLRSFQQQYPTLWKNALQPLLFEIARAVHTHLPPGHSNRLPYYAPQAKEFLKHWVVIREGDVLYTYRTEDLERADHPQTSSAPIICNDQIFHDGVEMFDPAHLMTELHDTLTHDVRNPRGDIFCYRVHNPSPGVLDIAGEDTTAPEQSDVLLQATPTASGYTVQDVQWRQISGPVAPPILRGGVWQIRTPKVVTDGVALRYEVTARNTLGHTAMDEVTIVVNNTVNELPTVALHGPTIIGDESVVTLTGKATDPNPVDQATLRYRWRQVAGPTVAVRDARDHRTISFQAPRVEYKTPVTFELTVEDSHGGTATARHSVLVVPEDTLHANPASANGAPSPVSRETADAKARTLRKLGPVTRVQPGSGNTTLAAIRRALRESTPVKAIEACLVVDHSGSMLDDVARIQREFASIKGEVQAAAQRGNLCLISFSETTVVRWPLDRRRSLDQDVQGMKNGLAATTRTMGGGYEYIAEAVNTALGQFTGGPRGVTRKIVVVTDERGDIREGGLTMAQVRQKAAALGVTVSVVMIDNSADFHNLLGVSMRLLLNDPSVQGAGKSTIYQQFQQQIMHDALKPQYQQYQPLWELRFDKP